MVSVVIGAAGTSQRFGKDKLSALLGGAPLLMRTIAAFETHKDITEIVIVTHPNRIQELEALKKSFKKISHVVAGSDTRQESITAGVQAAKYDIVLTHNGANPLVTQQEITETITAVKEHDAAFVGRKAHATIRRINSEEKGTETLDRSHLVEVETPQGFYKNDYLNAINLVHETLTDEIAVLETLGIQAKMVEASAQNKKVTTKTDLRIAESFLQPKTSIGFGHDSHRFMGKSDNAFITLAGVQIPHTKSFDANSDGDVITHTLCNAIGTAIGQGSLSHYADAMCKQGVTDSLEYLKHIYDEMTKSNYAIGNIAISLEGKEPKLEKYIPQMKKNLANILHINEFQIGISCTTGEDLTEFGKGNGIQCFCNAILLRK